MKTRLLTIIVLIAVGSIVVLVMAEMYHSKF